MPSRACGPTDVSGRGRGEKGKSEIGRRKAEETISRRAAEINKSEMINRKSEAFEVRSGECGVRNEE